MIHDFFYGFGHPFLQTWTNSLKNSVKIPICDYAQTFPRVYASPTALFAYAIKIIKNIYKNSLFSGWVDGYSGSSTTPARGQLFPTVETTWREYKNPSCVWPKGGGGGELLI